MSCCFSVFAITGAEVVDKYFELNPAPVFSKTDFKVDSYKNGKLEQSVTLTQFGRHKNELTETVFEVEKDSKKALNETRFLQSQKKNGDDARWIFMPSLKTVRRIASGDASKSFVGTEFTYNDTALRDTNEDDHELVAESKSITTKSGKTYNCYVVKSVPKIKKNIEFAYRVQYFDHDSVMPVRIEYFDRNDKPTKTMEIQELVQLNGNMGKKYYCRKVTEITNFQTNRRSVLTILNMVLDTQLKDGYFTQNWLSSGK